MSLTNCVVIEEQVLEFGKFELWDNGILFWQPKEGVTTINLDELKVMLTVGLEITHGKPLPLLNDNRQYEFLGFQERKFIGENLHRFASASAVLEDSPIVRFIGHTINQLFPPEVPMRLFKHHDQAVSWLIKQQTSLL